MTDNLRDRIERVIENHTLINGADECICGCLWQVEHGFSSSDGSTCYDQHLAAQIIRELGQRRCERCRHYTPLDQFPLPYEGSDRMRPFCNTCTDYIEWVTS